MKKLFFKPLRLSAILILLILSFHGCSTGDGSSPGDIFNLTLEKLVRVFRWTAPGDDGETGRATIYDLRFFDESEVAALLGLSSLDGVDSDTISSTVIANFGSATQIRDEPDPEEAGTPQIMPAPRLDILGQTRFFFAITARDEVGNSNNPSNVVEVETPLVSVDFTDSTPGSCLGESVGSGDFDDDQVLDLLIGDPCLGRVYLFYGQNSEDTFDVDPDGVIDLGGAGSADTVIIGNAADGFGSAVDGIAHVAGDIGQEIVIGAPDFDGARGTIIFIEGDTDRLPAVIDLTGGDSPLFEIEGENPGDRFGAEVEGALGIEGRLRRNMLVSAPGFNGSRGRVYLFRAGDVDDSTTVADAQVRMDGESPGDGFGTEIGVLGDIDDDGLIDFGVNSPGAGKVYVFFGSGEFPDIDLSSDTSLVTIISGSPGEDFGASFDGGADIDGFFDPEIDFPDDGAHDVVVGVPGANGETGQVLLFSGEDVSAARGAGVSPSIKTTYSGIGPGDRFGQSVAVVGDVNPNLKRFERTEGIILVFELLNGDFVVGAPGTADGTFYLFFGSDALPAALSAGDAALAVNGSPADKGFGESIFGVGDVSGDFLNDFVLLLDGAAILEF